MSAPEPALSKYPNDTVEGIDPLSFALADDDAQDEGPRPRAVAACKRWEQLITEAQNLWIEMLATQSIAPGIGPGDLH